MRCLIFFVLQGLCPAVLADFNRSIYSHLATEQKLYDDLLDGYVASVRPAENLTEPVQVSFSLSVNKILDLSERDEHLDIVAWTSKSWHDVRLRWNKHDYLGIDQIRIPWDRLWVPDIAPYNDFETKYDNQEKMASVFTSGHVILLRTARLRTTCRVDLTKFPFDQHSCNITFGSLTYSDSYVNLTLQGGDKGGFHLESNLLNSEWTVIDKSAKETHKKYACCPESYVDITFNLLLKRNPAFYVQMLVLPAILLGVLVPFQLLLPPESKERLTLGGILMMSVILLSLKFQDVLPETTAVVPAIEMYYSLTLIWIVLSMLSSVWVLNVHNRGPRRGKVPDIIRWIFLRSLKRLVCLGGDSYYPLDEMETITMRGLDKSNTVGIPSPGDGQVRNQESRSPSKLERDVEELVKQLHHLTTRNAIAEARQDMLKEWHQVALVLDRVLFLFFIIIFIMCSIILLS